MKVFYLILSLTLNISWAQQDFFTVKNKLEGLRHYKAKLYNGCSDLKEKQDPVSSQDMLTIGNRTKNLVLSSFSKAFKENPAIKKAYEEDIDKLIKDPSCQREGNDCRARLLGLSIYYYQTLRIDFPECKGIVADKELCHAEIKFHKSSLQGVQVSSYSSGAAGKFKKHLMKTKDRLTSELFNIIMHKDKQNLHICNPVRSGIVHRYDLQLEEPGDYHKNLVAAFEPDNKMIEGCREEKHILSREFILGNFDVGRNTVGRDQVEPLRQKIIQFLKSQTEVIVTDVIVTASSSKTPLYKTKNGKKILDPEGNTRNLSVATERAGFISKMLSELKASQSQYRPINFEARAELAGPDFEMMDLNDRFVTRMTPGYMEKIENLFKKYQKEYDEKAFKTESTDLYDEKKYVNIYQAKFKPFHGFSIVIKGHKKSEMKCSDPDPHLSSDRSSTSKQ